MNKSFGELKELVLEWANDKDLLHEENADKQFMKFIEEVFEFKTEFDSSIGFINRDLVDIREDMMLEMGDIFVTLIILCEDLEIDPVVCLEMAYKKISKRKGKTINGTFVKSEDL
ncbi:MazG-like family protein [Anaerococcus rubeinfantis]|uniref:MazG-like family protein n=1 Tax=Anaerococcus rubeinfantis TaxID=1720199 RepID=UPI00073E3CC6|nr:MazG-like family protein [Anaerococcus rubeinfantis]